MLDPIPAQRFSVTNSRVHLSDDRDFHVWGNGFRRGCHEHTRFGLRTESRKRKGSHAGLKVAACLEGNVTIWAGDAGVARRFQGEAVFAETEQALAGTDQASQARQALRAGRDASDQTRALRGQGLGSFPAQVRTHHTQEGRRRGGERRQERGVLAFRGKSNELVSRITPTKFHDWLPHRSPLAVGDASGLGGFPLSLISSSLHLAICGQEAHETTRDWQGRRDETRHGCVLC